MDITLLIGDFYLSSTLINSLLVFAILIIFFIVAGLKINKTDPSKPSGTFVAMLEFIYSYATEFVHENVNEQATKYVTFGITVASYLALANLVGLFGLTAPVTNLSITLGLTLVTLGYIIVSGVRSKGIKQYLKDTYLGDVPKPMLILFIPINIVGEVSKVISLTFRLFGNMVSGMLLLGLVMQFFAFLFDILPSVGWVTIFVLPLLNGYFDIFAGLMQTFIFCTLMMVFMKAAVE